MFGSGEPKCSAQNVGVSPGEYIECNIVGLSLYTWLKCYSLGVFSDCMNVIVYYGYIYMIDRKCYLSGDALHGSGSRINVIVLQIYPKIPKFVTYRLHSSA